MLIEGVINETNPQVQTRECWKEQELLMLVGKKWSSTNYYYN